MPTVTGISFLAIKLSITVVSRQPLARFNPSWTTNTQAGFWASYWAGMYNQ